MKKTVSLLVSLMLLCALATGCSTASSQKAVFTSAQADSVTVDIDLTALNSTVLYAQIYDIMSYPFRYEGQTIKIRGQYGSSIYEPTGLTYHFILISDPTACCQQPIEFVLSGEHDESVYPKEDENIELIGSLERYEEQGNFYYRLAVEVMTVL